MNEVVMKIVPLIKPAVDPNQPRMTKELFGLAKKLDDQFLRLRALRRIYNSLLDKTIEGEVAVTNTWEEISKIVKDQGVKDYDTLDCRDGRIFAIYKEQPSEKSNDDSFNE